MKRASSLGGISRESRNWASTRRSQVRVWPSASTSSGTATRNRAYAAKSISRDVTGTNGESLQLRQDDQWTQATSTELIARRPSRLIPGPQMQRMKHRLEGAGAEGVGAVGRRHRYFFSPGFGPLGTGAI